MALFSVLNEREFEILTPFVVTGLFLLVFGLWAYYEREHAWFGRLAKPAFWAMAVGTVVTAISLPIAEYGPGVAFIGFLLGLLVAMLGALGFGVAMLRADVAPRSAAWVLILALPVGVPLTIAFTTYVMGEGAGFVLKALGAERLSHTVSVCTRLSRPPHSSHRHPR